MTNQIVDCNKTKTQVENFANGIEKTLDNLDECMHL